MREKKNVYFCYVFTENTLDRRFIETTNPGNGRVWQFIISSEEYLPWMTYENYIRVFARYTLAIEVYVHRRYRQSVCNIIICGPSENFLRPQEGFQPYAVMLSEQCFYPLINQLKQ